MNSRVILGATVAAAAAVGMLAAPAQAQTGDACGTGYYVVHSESVVRDGDPLPAGTVYVEYNPLTNSFCGLTVKSRWIGTATRMNVTTIGSSENGNATDSVSGYSFYSIGPSRDAAWLSDGRNCVLFGATIVDPLGNSYSHQSANPAIGLTRYCV